MKRSTRVDKPNKGEQEPFSRQLANERKETRRLRDECAARIEAAKRKHAGELEAAYANLNAALEHCRAAIREHHDYVALREDFSRVAPVLRSKSRLRRLWWGLRFGLWGVFGFEKRR